MKKISIIVVLTLVVFACSRKTVTTTETKTQGPASDKADVSIETALVDEKLISNTPVKTDTAQNNMLVTGQRIYTANCGRCHELKPVEKFTAQQWEGILKNMIPKAKLNTAQGKQVTAYVMANAKK